MNDRDRKPKFRRGGGKAASGKREFGRRPAWRDREASPDGPVILYGWHTVAAALANPRRQHRQLLLLGKAARRRARENIERPPLTFGGRCMAGILCRRRCQLIGARFSLCCSRQPPLGVSRAKTSTSR